MAVIYESYKSKYKVGEHSDMHFAQLYSMKRVEGAKIYTINVY
jgi:hypothetical protein